MQEAQPHWNPSISTWPAAGIDYYSIILWGILVIAIQHPLLHSSQDQEGVNMHEE